VGAAFGWEMGRAWRVLGAGLAGCSSGGWGWAGLVAGVGMDAVPGLRNGLGDGSWGLGWALVFGGGRVGQCWAGVCNRVCVLGWETGPH
jgi:hypothetical protein